MSEALQRFAGSAGGDQSLRTIGLAGLCLEQRIVAPIPDNAAESAGPDPALLAADLRAEIAGVQALARALCATGLPDSIATAVVTGVVEAVLVAVIGDAVDADRLGLRRRVQDELARLGPHLAGVTLHVAPSDAALLTDDWSGPPALCADPSLARGCFEIVADTCRVSDAISDRLATCLRQLREP